MRNLLLDVGNGPGACEWPWGASGAAAGAEAAAVVDRVWWTMVGGWARGNACAPALPLQPGRTRLGSGSLLPPALLCSRRTPP